MPAAWPCLHSLAPAPRPQGPSGSASPDGGDPLSKNQWPMGPSPKKSVMSEVPPMPQNGKRQENGVRTTSRFSCRAHTTHASHAHNGPIQIKALEPHPKASHESGRRPQHGCENACSA